MGKAKKQELTEKQQVVYDLVKQEIKANGFPPSVREICKLLNLKSTSTVHMHLTSLERKGYIKHSPSKSRSIEILEEDFYFTNPNSKHFTVPIVGLVTAGEPIYADENIEDYFTIGKDYVQGEDDVFMLKIVGDSMINAGIHDKDLVLVKKQNAADNGDIVVALIEDEATVKTFHKEDNIIKLIPQNELYEPIIVEDMSVLGKVIGLYRKI